MIGVLVVTHYHVAEELVRALSLIVGEIKQVQAVGLDPESSPEEMRLRIEKALREVDSGNGVLVLVDMFGGRPSNLCLSFLAERRVEVVTGVNLPMLVKVGKIDETMPLDQVATLARDTGRKNISVASEVLSGSSGAEEHS